MTDIFCWLSIKLDKQTPMLNLPIFPSIEIRIILFSELLFVESVWTLLGGEGDMIRE